MKRQQEEAKRDECLNRTAGANININIIPNKREERGARRVIPTRVLAIMLLVLLLVLEQSNFETKDLKYFLGVTTATTSTVKAKGMLLPSFTLTVPFYVYPRNSSLHWDSMYNQSHLNRHKRYKHSDDYWLLQAAKKHPMRTENPEEAKLFFVPTLLSAAAYLPCDNPKNKDKGFRSLKEAFAYAGQELAGSEWFQRSNGSDHIVAMTHWAKLRKLSNKQLASGSNVLRCNLINFEGNSPRSAMTPVVVPSMYMGSPCGDGAKGELMSHPYNSKSTKKTHDFALIASMWAGATGRKARDFRSRLDICHWLKERNDKFPNNTHSRMDGFTFPESGERRSAKNLAVAIQY
jgi:hypothetical protein